MIFSRPKIQSFIRFHLYQQSGRVDLQLRSGISAVKLEFVWESRLSSSSPTANPGCQAQVRLSAGNLCCQPQVRLAITAVKLKSGWESLAKSGWECRLSSSSPAGNLGGLTQVRLGISAVELKSGWSGPSPAGNPEQQSMRCPAQILYQI